MNRSSYAIAAIGGGFVLIVGAIAFGLLDRSALPALAGLGWFLLCRHGAGHE